MNKLNEVNEGHPMLAPGSASGDVGADARRSGATVHCCRSLPVDGRPQAEGKRAKGETAASPTVAPQIRPPPPPPLYRVHCKGPAIAISFSFRLEYSSCRLGPTSALRSCTSVRPPPAAVSPRPSAADTRTTTGTGTRRRQTIARPQPLPSA